MDWKQLGINPTKDKKEITRAYRARLVDVNPEDKPEEFKRLREAYEEALRLAAQEEAPQEEKGPVELWADRLATLFADLRQRLNPDCWKELLADDVCIGLDTRPLAEEALLRFFMDHIYLPQNIWILLNEEFSFTERADELSEKYPPDFIEHIIVNGVRYAETLDLKYFFPGENGEAADEYTRIYLKARRAPAEEARQLLAQAESLSEHHPYGEILGYALDSGEGKTVNTERILELVSEYPDSTYLYLEAADIFNAQKEYALAEKMCRDMEAQGLFTNRAKWQLARALAGQENYRDATDLISDLMNDAGGDQRQIYQLNQTRQEWNVALTKQYRAALEQNPEDYESRAELAMCLLIADNYDEALACTLQLPENMPDPYAYNNLLGQIYAGMEQFEKSLPYLEALNAYIPTIVSDGTKKTEDRRTALPRKLSLQADILYMMERHDEALEVCARAVDLDPQNGDILSGMVRLCGACRKFRLAAEYAKRLTEALPGSYHSHLLLAYSLFELHNDRDAFAAVNKAMDIDASDLGEYTLKLRILIRNNAFDEAREILNFLRENGITEDPTVNFCEVMLADYEGEVPREEVAERYKALTDRIEAGEHFDAEAFVYFRRAVCASGNLDLRKDENAEKRKEILTILDKGLEADPRSMDCKDYKAWIYKEIRDNDKALELYHQLEQEDRSNLNVESNLAEIYYRNLEQNADKALVYYRKLLDNAPNDPVWMFYTAMCLLQMGDLDGAEKIFLQEEMAEPEYSDANFRLSFVYEAKGLYEKALENAEKALEIEKQGKNNLEKYYLRKVQILQRLGRPKEAVDCVMELVKGPGYKGANQKIYEIYAQFGMWDEAKKHVRSWIKTGQDKDNALLALIRTDIIPARMVNLPSQMDYANNKSGVSAWTRDSVDAIIASMEGKYRTALKIWQNRLQQYREDNYGSQSYAFSQLAQLSFLDKNPEKAREYAELGLVALERCTEGRFLRDEAIYRSRKALLLGFMGRIDEAYAELAATRALPLCESCSYCRCKDADIYEAYLSLIRGETDEAKALAERGLELTPDDEDYIIILNYIKKNTRRKW